MSVNQSGSANQSGQMLRLAALVQIEKRARSAKLEELGFIIVNETLGLLPYRQALLWQRQPRNKVIAVSGTATVEPNAPYIIWAQRLCTHVDQNKAKTATPAEISQFTATDLPEKVAGEWQDWMAPYLVWIPLGQGALLLGREAPLDDGDRALLAYLADAYDHAWRARSAISRFRDALPVKGKQRSIKWRWLLVPALAAIIAGSFYPVRQSVLAPGEIIPLEPTMVRAPLDGVIDRILVRPNQSVSAGDLLFVLDPRHLRNELEVSMRAREAAEAELRQAQQASVMDPEIRATLPVLQGKLEQQQAEVNYLTEQLSRIEVRTNRAGLAVFDDPNDWQGRPVVIGERIMLVADPAKVEIEARLPAADAIDLAIGSEVRLFLNIAPERPLEGELTFVSYQPQKGADGILSYRVKAVLTGEQALPRIGLKGTAKLYGAKVPLAYFIFRRPIAAARQWLGM